MSCTSSAQGASQLLPVRVRSSAWLGTFLFTCSFHCVCLQSLSLASLRYELRYELTCPKRCQLREEATANTSVWEFVRGVWKEKKNTNNSMNEWCLFYSNSPHLLLVCNFDEKVGCLLPHTSCQDVTLWWCNVVFPLTHFKRPEICIYVSGVK